MKVSLSEVVHYQVLLCLDTYTTDAIAINKLHTCMHVKFQVFYHVLSYKSAAGLSGLVLV